MVDLLGLEVGERCGHDDYVVVYVVEHAYQVRDAGETLHIDVTGKLNAAPAHPKVHFRTSPEGRLGELHSHESGGPVGNDPHRIYGFLAASSDDQDSLALQIRIPYDPLDAVHDLFRGCHLGPDSVEPRAYECDSPGLQLLDVVANGRVVEHRLVHGRCDGHRHTFPYGNAGHGGDRGVVYSVGDLGDGVGSGGIDKQEVCRFPVSQKGDVLCESGELGDGLVSRCEVQGIRCHQFLGLLRHHRDHVRSASDQFPDRSEALDGRYAAGYAHDYGLSLERCALLTVNLVCRMCHLITFSTISIASAKTWSCVCDASITLKPNSFARRR